jgi:8-oxo-dGTP diphosphatase
VYPVLAVGGIILIDRRIVLIKRASEPNKGKWTIPGGKVKFGENLESALKREIKEETNLEVEVGKMVCIYEYIKGGNHYVALDFLLTSHSGELKAMSDAAEIKLVELKEAIKMDITESTKRLVSWIIDGMKDPPIHIIDT